MAELEAGLDEAPGDRPAAGDRERRIGPEQDGSRRCAAS
jgi:hypothetical protein